jgi:hypothetical protein
MSVFSPIERGRHIENTRGLFKVVKGIREARKGYDFIFPMNFETMSRLAEFIVNERLCCPFLEFHLRVAPGDETILLSLTGPRNTPEFLRMEFSEAFS